MSLSPQQIQELLATTAKAKQSKRTKSRSGRSIDTSNRDIMTWFALAHRMLDANASNVIGDDAPAKCANPDCQDPRKGKYAQIATVNGQDMCRYCFMSGWLK
jgi:hypothetical protein